METLSVNIAYMPDYSNESLDRMQKIQKLKDAQVLPYANHYHGKQDIIDVLKQTQKVGNVEDYQENGVSNEFQLAGRLLSYKSHGKLAFAKILDHSGIIQICFMRDKCVFHTGWKTVNEIEIDGELRSAYKMSEKFLNVGDYIGVKGQLFYTKHEELTLFVGEFQILSKAVRPLPEKFHGLTDQEILYRQRYLDMIMNDDTYQRLRLRSKYVKVLRDFYESHQFVEIETPIL